MSWADAREIIGDERVLLGPQASYQWTHDPRHLLFVLARYKHAARLIGAAERVLEVGCGEGIGARLLGDAREYIGLDPDRAALDIAGQQLWRGSDPGTGSAYELVVGTLETLPPWRRFDAIVALDVIEHLTDEDADRFIDLAASRLDPGGILVLGTPNKTADLYQSEASRAGHVVLYGGGDLRLLIGQSFQTVQLFGMNDEVLHTGFLPMAHYLMAVGIGPRHG